MLTLKLAFRNLMGAGLRTFLNVAVLSMAYVVIIWQQGLLDGWNQQAKRDMIDWEIGGGQYWHEAFDPYDPFTLEESHAPLPAKLTEEVIRNRVAPILIAQATIYPQGRMKNVILKGIPPGQQALSLPTAFLEDDTEEIPLLIGTRMARSMNLDVGDVVTVRWRDSAGTFDASEGKVVQVMKTNVPTVDQGVLWLPLEQLQAMMQMPGEATVVVLGQQTTKTPEIHGWIFRDRKFLLRDIADLIKFKSASGYIIYGILLSLALIAIFDTQVLAVFRRRKEIGTLMALGMTRGRVICLFTIEGAMHGVLAGLASAAYGIPLLRWQAIRGFTMPKAAGTMGLAIAEKIFPVYSVGLILSTTIIVLIAVTMVSFMPTRRIARLNPTDAIKGKLP